MRETVVVKAGSFKREDRENDTAVIRHSQGNASISPNVFDVIIDVKWRQPDKPVQHTTVIQHRTKT